MNIQNSDIFGNIGMAQPFPCRDIDDDDDDDIPLFVPQWGNFKNHSSGTHQSINENKYQTQN